MSEMYAARSTNHSEQAEDQHRFMIFELDDRGHHPEYIRHLIRYWCEHDLPGQLDLLVTRLFVQRHTHILNLASQCPRIRFVTISESEEAQLVHGDAVRSSTKGRIVRAFQEWRLLRKYATQLGTTHIFSTYLDRMLFRLAVGVRPPCAMSAIFFHPLLHYAVFPSYSREKREGFWQWRDHVCLSRLLPNRKLQNLFFLDPFAADYVNQVYGTTKAVHLADPVEQQRFSEVECEQLRNRLGIQPGRTMFLLFGAPGKRKGFRQVLDAIALLPPALCRRMALVLAGPISREYEELEEQITELTKTRAVQIVAQTTYVPDDEVQLYFQAADVVLAPYQRHIGMSGILVRSAAAQTPVLSSDFGLMGEMIQRYQLGLGVDSTSPEAISQGIMRYLLEIPGELCDRALQKQFADRNTPEQFASQIFQAMYSTPPRGGLSLASKATDTPQLSNSRRL
ncbi:putative N-acetylglucosaminyltransferase [Leptolyngbya sp. NIES-3755]|nr:putative N-acetylglucosaminyltransferase [Leptolyngbya sp. NIES-3755]